MPEAPGSGTGWGKDVLFCFVLLKDGRGTVVLFLHPKNMLLFKQCFFSFIMFHIFPHFSPKKKCCYI